MLQAMLLGIDIGLFAVAIGLWISE